VYNRISWIISDNSGNFHAKTDRLEPEGVIYHPNLMDWFCNLYKPQFCCDTWISVGLVAKSE